MCWKICFYLYGQWTSKTKTYFFSPTMSIIRLWMCCICTYLRSTQCTYMKRVEPQKSSLGTLFYRIWLRCSPTEWEYEYRWASLCITITKNRVSRQNTESPINNIVIKLIFISIIMIIYIYYYVGLYLALWHFHMLSPSYYIASIYQH